MENPATLFQFLTRIQADPRISAAHISVFAALTFYQYQHHEGSSFRAFSKEIMKIAKISSSSTYHKCILELNAYGYLNYKASYSKRLASLFYLTDNISFK